MNDDKKISELAEPLLTALELERKGMAFFRKAAAKTSGELARKTFEFLADEEAKHIERITSFYKTLTDEGLKNLPETFPSDTDKRLSEFNQKLAELGKSISATTSDVEAYRTALAFEDGAEEFYTEQAGKAEAAQVQAFYRWLVEEEKMHGLVIKSCIEFASDPEAWFKKENK